MKTCIIYLRVSREKNGEKELSIDSQLQQCENKAKSLNADVANVFSDRDKSGRNNNRPQFQAAIEYCECSSTDYFIVWSTSRFARNIIDAKTDKIRLEKAGTKVKYVTTEIENSDSGFLHESILELFDEFYSRQIGADTKRSMTKNAADGYWNGGRLAYGFMVIKDIHDSKRKRLIINDDEAEITKKIFKMRLSGIGAKIIADKLNSTGVYRRGEQWTKKQITSLLRNEKNIGITSFGQRNHNKVKQPKEKWTVVKSHEPIIEINTWEKVQQIMDESTNISDNGSPRSNLAFTGILRCKDCDLNMKSTSGKGRTRRYYYYSCPNSKSAIGCNTRALPADKTDIWIIDQICKIIFTPKNLKNIANELSTSSENWNENKAKLKNKYKQELASLERKNNRFYDLIEAEDNELNIGDLSPRIKSNNSKINKIERELDKLERSYNPSNKEIRPEQLSRFLIEKISNSENPKLRRQFIKSFVNKMEITEGRITIEYAPELLLNTSNVLVPSKGKWLPDRSLQGTINIIIDLPLKMPSIAA